jgi:O-antigen ligase
MDHNYNPHNQYLSSFLALGITGLVVMLVWMLWPLISAWRDKDYPGMVWMLMMLLHFFFESMLNRSPGVLLIAFFYGLLIVQRYRKEP